LADRQRGQIGDIYYTVIGVVDTIAGSERETGGFAWILSDRSVPAEVIYLKPANYDPVSARFDAENLLNYLGYHHRDFFLTDGNEYSRSIATRGYLFLLLCTLGFVILIYRWLIKLFRSAKSKSTYIAAGFFAFITLVVTAVAIWKIASVDLWLPAYMGTGITAYARFIFNIGCLAPGAYLPLQLSSLLDLNIRANVAFGVGLTGLMIVAITRFVIEKPPRGQ